MGIFQFIAKTIAPEEFNAENSTLKMAAKGLEDGTAAVLNATAMSSAVMTAANAAVSLSSGLISNMTSANVTQLTGAGAYLPAAGLPSKGPQATQGLGGAGSR